MDFDLPEEHIALRKMVGAIADRFGPDYYTSRAEARQPTPELWA